jgi:2-iminobutanoate/2-iminopropanoate deaminase
MKTIITTKNAPVPIGPYNQAILSENTLYTSGQIAINPESGELVLDDIKKETAQVMRNLAAVLKAANMNFDNVIKSSIFISNMNDFNMINSVYGSYFDDAIAPARETVQVAKLPKDVNVEISVIAVK